MSKIPPPKRTTATVPATTTRLLELDLIRIDGETQPRAAIHEDTLAEYADDIKAGATFPPLTVYHDGKDFWLADGFHRWHAFRRAGVQAAMCTIMRGSQAEAQWHACGANCTHGLRRTREDKRRAVELALANASGKEMADRDIARHCGVSHTFVAGLRRGPSGNVARPTPPADVKRADSPSAAAVPARPQNESTYDNSPPPADAPIPMTAEADTSADIPMTGSAYGETTAEPVEPVDQAGQPLPPQVRPDFARRGEINRLTHMLTLIKTEALDKQRRGDPLYADLNISAFEAEVGNVRRHLTSCLPHAVCPYCRARQTSCRACHGRGWVNEALWNQAPAELRRAPKGA